jgi:membrane protease YdiL (CAAX protease family)
MSSLGETGTIGLWVIAAFSVVAFPLAEEFIFRGFAFKALQVAMRPGYAALAVSFVFVLVHAPEKIHYPPGFLAVTILAIGAIWLRIKSNSVWPPTLLHGLYNAGVIVDAIIVGTHASHIHMS